MLRALSCGFRYFYITSWFILMPGLHTYAVANLAEASKSCSSVIANVGFLFLLFTFREPTFAPSFQHGLIQ